MGCGCDYDPRGSSFHGVVYAGFELLLPRWGVKSADLVQIEFARGSSRKVVWVDSSWHLRLGDRVSFVDDYETGFLEEPQPSPWTVKKIYSTKIQSQQIYRRWGLDLPKSERTER